MKAIVLAAGKGTRLHSEEADLPKALRLLRDKPLIHYVLDSLDFLPQEDIAIVVGFQGEKVVDAIGGRYRYVEQKQPYNGTARATLSAREVFGDVDEPVLICYCDMPFLTKETYRRMLGCHVASDAGNTILAGKVNPPLPYGRLIYDEKGRLVDIIEESAATPEQRKLDILNIGIQVLDGARMWDWLEKVDNDNPKQEYYLTSLARVLAKEMVHQEVVMLENHDEMLGVNTDEDLRAAEALMDRLHQS